MDFGRAVKSELSGSRLGIAARVRENVRPRTFFRERLDRFGPASDPETFSRRLTSLTRDGGIEPRMKDARRLKEELLGGLLLSTGGTASCDDEIRRERRGQRPGQLEADHHVCEPGTGISAAVRGSLERIVCACQTHRTGEPCW